MAQLFADPADPTAFARVSIPILKFEEDPTDGSVYVYGRATDDTLDSDRQIIDPKFAASSLARWFETGANVRVQHNPALYPAGKGVELTSADDGQWLKSKVVEPTAIRLVKEGVLQAYSVGIAQPQVIRDSVAKNGRIVGGETVEVSLVDRPANPSCGLVLAKAAGSNVELLADFIGDAEAAEKAARADLIKSFSPADLAAVLEKKLRRDAAEKRDMDPDVGGGVDRDKLAASDFVFGDERKFPVVTPGDVPDAVSSWGRYKGAHSFAEFKAKLTALAKRKGEEFVAKLPDEWADGHADGSKAADPEVTKAARDCPKCGAPHHADSPDKFCANCGTKLPPRDGDGDGKTGDKADGKAEKSAASATEAVPDAFGQVTGALREALAAQAADPDRATGPADSAAQAHPESATRETAASVSAQAADMAGDKPATKTATLDEPAAPGGLRYGLKRLHDVTCAAYPWHTVKAAHPAVEKDGIGSVLGPTAAGMVFQMLADAVNTDGGVGCCADDICHLGKAYKILCELVMDQAYGGQGGAMVLAEARAELHKAFGRANPSAPDLSPTTMGEGQNPDPARWRRPYISAGHANSTASPGQKPTIPMTAHVPNAGDFGRGLITAGHESDSPANSGGGIRPVSTSDRATPVPSTPAPGEKAITPDMVKRDSRIDIFRNGVEQMVRITHIPTGETAHGATEDAALADLAAMLTKSGRTFYTNDAKANAMDVMKRMHDHIADVFPDCCPMAPPMADQEYQPLAVPNTLDTRGSSTPAPVAAVSKTTEPGLPKAATAADLPALVKAAVAELAGEQLAAYEATITELRKANHDRSTENGELTNQLAALKSKFTELAAEPDPRQAAVRGMAGLEQFLAKRSSQEPPGGVTDRRVEFYQAWLESPDPAQRETARELLRALGH